MIRDRTPRGAQAPTRVQTLLGLQPLPGVHTPRASLFLLAVLAVLLVPSLLYAQEESEARRSLFEGSFEEGSLFSDEQKAIIQESLLLQLQNRVEGMDVILAESAADQDRDIFSWAVLNGADSVLRVSFSGSMDLLQSRFSLYDAFLGEVRSSFAVEGPVDSRYRNLFGGYWYEAIQELNRQLLPVISQARLSVQALPGSLVRIPYASPGGEDIEQLVPADGGLSFDLPVPASYSLEVSLPGHFAEREGIFLQSSAMVDIASRQERLDIVYVQPFLHLMSFPALELGVFLSDSRWRLGIISGFYQIGLQPFSSDDDGQQEGGLVAGFPLMTAGVRGSHRLDIIPWSLPVQPVLGASVNLRFLTLEGFRIDPLLPAELRLDAGLDWQMGRHSALFVNMDIPMYILPDESYFGAMDAESEAGLVRLFGVLLFSQPQASLGIRLGL